MKKRKLTIEKNETSIKKGAKRTEVKRRFFKSKSNHHSDENFTNYQRVY
jgi:hypothetical protein